MPKKTIPRTETYTLDLDKLKALVHYICYKCPEPSLLGATKLNKILWYSDVVSYLRTGKPITGEKYTKRQFGPVPKHILSVLRNLEEKGLLAVKEADHFGYDKKEYIALKAPDLSKFTAEQIAIVDSIIEEICYKHTADTISKASHDIIWALAEIGEEIPLYAVLASKLGEITESDIEWAKRALATAEANAI